MDSERNTLAAALLGIRWNPNSIEFAGSILSELHRMGFAIVTQEDREKAWQYDELCS